MNQATEALQNIDRESKDEDAPDQPEIKLMKMQQNNKPIKPQHALDQPP